MRVSLGASFLAVISLSDDPSKNHFTKHMYRYFVSHLTLLYHRY